MIKWIVVAVALVLASSVQAMPLAPLQMPDDVVIKAREGVWSGHAPGEWHVHQNGCSPRRKQVCQGSDVLS